jgi:hypothetical protein
MTKKFHFREKYVLELAFTLSMRVLISVNFVYYFPNPYIIQSSDHYFLGNSEILDVFSILIYVSALIWEINV